MCADFSERFLPQSVDASYLIKEAPKSLLYQSRADRKHLQADGWGIGWFENGRPRIVKSPRPIYRDKAICTGG